MPARTMAGVKWKKVVSVIITENRIPISGPAIFSGLLSHGWVINRTPKLSNQCADPKIHPCNGIKGSRFIMYKPL
jgi:hypothetical protein